MKEKVDIINFQTPLSLGFEAIMVGKILKIPVVGTFHTFGASKEYLKHSKIMSKIKNAESIAWTYLNLFYNRCNHVLTVSDYTKKELIQEGVTKPIQVINCNIDIEKFGNKPFTKFKIPKNSFVYLGRLAHEKNIEKLVLGFGKAIKKNKSIRLYCIGDGPEEKLIKKLVNKKKLQKKIIFTGRLPNEIIMGTNLMSKFKAFVTMSNTENQPMTIIEAMRKKLPIIGPKVRGITELIQGNGILVNKDDEEGLADALLTMVENPQLQKEYSENSYMNSEKFDLKKIINQLERFYVKVIKEN